MVIGTTYIAQQKLECSDMVEGRGCFVGVGGPLWLVWEAEYYENISDYK